MLWFFSTSAKKLLEMMIYSNSSIIIDQYSAYVYQRVSALVSSPDEPMLTVVDRCSVRHVGLSLRTLNKSILHMGIAKLTDSVRPRGLK